MRVLIIDNYDSFIYNLAQYVGELGGEPIVYRSDEITLKDAIKIEPNRIILSPGPSHPANRRYFGVCLELLTNLSKHVPTLGVCLGHQGIIYAFGGRIVRSKRIMHGKTSLIVHDGLGIYRGVENPFKATRYHSLVGDKSALPPCLKVTARSLDDDEIMGVRHKIYPIEGVQFHPESILTSEGKKIIRNFLEWGVSHDS
ncbi:MAG: aminodeoxychorismate/anthranilate synthase component II [Candidatus Bathyarchaeia archaeon]|nr:aminodeoxychorismate/anthranilate synthase component II [Candidatus Bathyarchaeota archaeon]